MKFVRAFLHMFFSAFKACFVLGILFGLLMGLKEHSAAIFLAPFFISAMSMLIGPFFAFPAIIASTFVCLRLIKKDMATRRNFVICGAGIGALYGSILQLLSWFNMPYLFIVGGALTGWFAMNDLDFVKKRKVGKTCSPDSVSSPSASPISKNPAPSTSTASAGNPPAPATTM
jgi:hypothetical protein